MASELNLEKTSTVARGGASSAPSGCQMAAFLEMLTRPWTLHILWQLGRNGPMRFGALKRSIEGISARLLTLRLRSLEEEGFVRRTIVQGKNPEVTYTPTNRASDMDQVMQLLHDLSVKWKSSDKAN